VRQDPRPAAGWEAGHAGDRLILTIRLLPSDMRGPRCPCHDPACAAPCPRLPPGSRPGASLAAPARRCLACGACHGAGARCRGCPQGSVGCGECDHPARAEGSEVVWPAQRPCHPAHTDGQEGLPLARRQCARPSERGGLRPATHHAGERRASGLLMVCSTSGAGHAGDAYRRARVCAPPCARVHDQHAGVRWCGALGGVCSGSGIHVRRDSGVSVRYAEELNSGKSSVTLQRTDRHGSMGQKSTDFQLSL